MKVNSLEKQSKQKSKDKFSCLTEEHTFKPKINVSTKTAYLHSSTQVNGGNASVIKGTAEKRGDEKFYERLLKWGKNHTDRQRENYLRGQVKKNSLDKSGEYNLNTSQEKINKLQSTMGSIEKMERRLIESLNVQGRKRRQEGRGYVKGEESFYQRQAKAVALKNGQTYYYSSNLHQIS